MFLKCKVLMGSYVYESNMARVFPTIVYLSMKLTVILLLMLHPIEDYVKQG